MPKTRPITALVEVGLGGSFDATNVIDNPLVAVIANISLDHLQQLGDRVEEIAVEKAGIIKPGRPVVIAPQLDSVVEVLVAIAAERGAPAIVAGRDYTFFEQGGASSIRTATAFSICRCRGCAAAISTPMPPPPSPPFAMPGSLPDEAFETAMASVSLAGQDGAAEGRQARRAGAAAGRNLDRWRPQPGRRRRHRLGTGRT